MSARHAAIPDGCLNCNREQRQVYLDKLHALEIHVEAVPTPQNITSNIIICRRCGQAWLLMPRSSSEMPT